MSESKRASPAELLAPIPADWTGAAAPLPTLGVRQQFELQVEATPQAIALICGTTQLSYEHLNRRANRVAHRLIGLGCARGSAVAVLLDRGPDLIAALLGVLKAGAYYVPVDPEYPGERIEFVLQDCAPAALVTQERTLSKFDAKSVPLLVVDRGNPASGNDGNPESDCSLDDPVYAIYTSGSTGRPKGALLYQRGAVNLLQWYTGVFAMRSATTFLMIASISFDLQQKSVFAPLLVGGKLVIPDSQAFDPPQIRALVAEHQVTHINCAPSAFYTLLEDADEAVWRQLASLTHVFLGGELIHKPRLRPWQRQRWCKAEVINSYGPTECTDVQVYHRIAREEFEHDSPIPIGRPIANCYLYVLDEHLQPVKVGEKGLLWISGICVGGGYINLPERTAESFCPNPFRPGETMYATGDVVSWRVDGVLDCFGRFDHQVKVRGFRIELGEIESALAQHPSVAECAVTAPEGERGERFLSAYVRLKSGVTADAADLGRFLGKQLPQHMLPAAWTFVDKFAVTTSGKLDRLVLPVPARGLQSTRISDGASLEERIADQWSNLLGGREVPPDARFFELGGTSLQAIQFVGQLNKLLGVIIPMVEFFRTPTVTGFSDYLYRTHPDVVGAWIGRTVSARAPAAKMATRSVAPKFPGADSPIAVVGLASRLPDAPDVETFWANLLAGKESLHLLSRAELEASGLPESVWNQPDYVPVTAWMRDSECFDHRFFGYAPREADVIDPQQRVLLETSWAALEHAGIAVDRGNRSIGVFTGVAPNTYFSTGLITHPEFRQFGLTHTVLASDKDYSATRVAFKLDLHGPAVSIQTACSSSGTAIHMACLSLKAGDCHTAIAGGACLPWHYRYGHEYVEDGPLTKDGHISVFDASGSGMALTGGVACVVLKRLDDAIADGDTVYAVIKATAVNNDGSGKVAFTAPSVDGQVGVIRDALARAGVSAETISYVEAHGTGTRLGDPIEVGALTQAYREHTDKVGFCRIGSAKTNVGHLDAASATVGLIKASLALSGRELPPSLNYRTPNPECAFDTSPFVVNTERRTWTCSGPLRAGISSFGFGGTNFHAVLEEPPVRESSPAKRTLQVLRLAAKTDESLKQAGANLAEWLGRHSEARLADVAFTLDTGRARFEKRAFVVARDTGEAQLRLLSDTRITGGPIHARPSLVYMFPGQGSQHVGMGAQLYDNELIFRTEVDRCAEILEPLLKLDLRDVLYPKSDDREKAAATLRSTQLAQPAIFTISYATAKLWQSWGLEPEHMIGHSVGEFVAATLAGVFELPAALAILAERARLMQSMPSGGMLAVRLPEDEARQHCEGGVAIAGVNSPQLTVLSGPHAELEAIKLKLDAQGVGTTVLHTSHAFHSSMMEPVVEPFTGIVGRQMLNKPALPFYSSLTGKPITDAQATDPGYWAAQLRNAVRFAPGLLELAERKGRVFLECGPGQNLSTSSKQSLKPAHQAQVVASLPHSGAESADDAEHAVQALGRLWLAGIEAAPSQFYLGEMRLKIGLPTYAFAKDRHFIDPLRALTQSTAAAESVAMREAEAVAPLAPATARQDSPQVQAMALASKIFSDVTGIEIAGTDADRTFLELGFDSLLLTQVAAKLKTAFKVNLRFRQLLEQFTSLNALAEHLAPSLPQSTGSTAAATAAPPPDASVPATAAPTADGKPAKAFGAGVRISKAKADGLTPQQRKSLEALMQRYMARTSGSKASAEKHRAYLADPRTVSGFRPLWKEVVYPIVTTRSDGPYLWDVDGNRYIDVINGFGTTFFGHKPEFVNQAIREQLEKGYEIGPIQDFIGEAAEIFTRMVKLPRVAFCNTGSEAVSAAVRCARTVTGKDLVASFTGDYHGIHDEVIVRPSPSGRGLPAAGGIPNSHVANTLILDYGEARSLEILRARADELAAIMIEPVQSRRPDLQPREFMQACREIADQAGCALIMDEVICGFRCAPGGAQEFFGVSADIGTYGKVFGGGMPIGAIAGVPKYLDALDGGHWRFGDDSVPEVGVTYFAGTFVRHPVNMAAVLATLRELEARPNVQREMNERVAAFVERIRALIEELRAPLRVAHFSSFWRFEWTQDEAFGELFYYYLRERGLHAYDGRLAVMTTTHDEAILERILGIYRDALVSMQRDGLLGRVGEPVVMGQARVRSGAIWYEAPEAGALIGRDENGNPAWFLPDPNRPGKYLQLARTR